MGNLVHMTGFQRVAERRKALDDALDRYVALLERRDRYPMERWSAWNAEMDVAEGVVIRAYHAWKAVSSTMRAADGLPPGPPLGELPDARVIRLRPTSS